MSRKVEAAIIGAGPYGLSIAAHLRARGVEPLVFGEPMSFWTKNMPKDMLLRSPWEATHLSDAKNSLTLEAFQAETGESFTSPVPLDKFVEYGRWFQKRSVPEVDRRWVSRVEKNGSFKLTLADGDTVQTNCAIVAAGIQPFANIPATFAKMPRELASHCSEHVDLGRFSGKEVIVVGAGQSALESAALLHESGAKVEVLVREAVVYWLRRLPWVHKSLWAKLLYAPADVGPAGMSHVVARPQYFRMLPRKVQDKWGVRAIRPAGARWLVERCKDIPMHTGTWIVEAKEANGRVQVKLNDGTQRVVDHVLLGTGYRVDIRKYPFLSESLLDSVDMINGYPQLNRTFESSIPGLFFAGAPAAWSYGPLMRFVVGAHFVAGRLSGAAHAHIGRSSRARGATSGK